MAIGIGRAAYEYARDFVKENYVLSRPSRGTRRSPSASRRWAATSRPRASLVARDVHGRPGDRQREGGEHGPRRARPPRAGRDLPRASRRSRSAARTAKALATARGARAAREVVPRHQGLRHLRGHRGPKRIQRPLPRPLHRQSHRVVIRVEAARWTSPSRSRPGSADARPHRSPGVPVLERHARQHPGDGPSAMTRRTGP
jgi:hypothetical protein